MPLLPERDIYTQNRAYSCAWIVYINGIEVPATSVTVSYGVWAIPEAQITMVPDATLQRLGSDDRLDVQVFYCDQWIDTDKPEFRLMFDGEIVGWSYVNVNKARAISFNAIDYMQIFTQLFFFFMSSVDDFVTTASGANTGADAGTITESGFAPIYPYSLFTRGLVGNPFEGNPNVPATAADTSGGDRNSLIKRPVDFVYNIVKALVSSTTERRTVAAANFFSPWAKRTNFHKRFVALPYLESNNDNNPAIFPILKAAQANFAIGAVAQQAGRIGNSGSIWQMLNEIMRVLMMEISMLPTAPAVRADFELNILGPSALGAPLNNTTPIFLANYMVKPQTFFALPPTCNVFFPSQINTFSYEENYVTQPTRVYFDEETLGNLLNLDNNENAQGLGTILRDALAVAHPEEANSLVRAVIGQAGANNKNILIYPDEFFRGPVVDRRPLPEWFFFLRTLQNTPTAQQPQPEGSTPSERTVDQLNPSNQTPSELTDGESPEPLNIYRTYAAYEYYKEKYDRRKGAATLVFNPYPVPGFPCAFFDRRSSRVDIFAYLTNVRQQLTTRGWTTDVSFTHGRTMQEMFETIRKRVIDENTAAQGVETALRTRNQPVSATPTLVTTPGVTGETARTLEQSRAAANQARVEAAVAAGSRRNGAIPMAPLEPLPPIRAVMQDFDKANEFYKTLFFRKISPDTQERTVAQAGGNTAASQAQRILADELNLELLRQQSLLQELNSRLSQDVIGALTPTEQALLAQSTNPNNGLTTTTQPLGTSTGDVLQDAQNTLERTNRAILEQQAAVLGRSITALVQRITPLVLQDQQTDQSLNLLGTITAGQVYQGFDPALKKDAVFRYPDVITFDLEDNNPESAQENIQIQGLTRDQYNQCVGIITSMRVGAASQTQIATVQQLTGRSDINRQQVFGEPLDPVLDQFLADFLVQISSQPVISNLRGSNISPRSEYAGVFESYDLAMFYNARPICTLDEYVAFSGGEAQGEILPGVALSVSDPRTFPSKYYTRIRTYRSGTIEPIPNENLTGVALITGEDGLTPLTRDVNSNVVRVQGIGENFPERRLDWDSLLLQYRNNVLTRLPPLQ